MIINAGISEVVYDLDYPLNGTAQNLLEEAGVEARRLACEPVTTSDRNRQETRSLLGRDVS